MVMRTSTKQLDKNEELTQDDFENQEIDTSKNQSKKSAI
jgi:hypothetical protein